MKRSHCITNLFNKIWFSIGNDNGNRCTKSTLNPKCSAKWLPPQTEDASHSYNRTDTRTPYSYILQHGMYVSRFSFHSMHGALIHERMKKMKTSRRRILHIYTYVSNGKAALASEGEVAVWMDGSCINVVIETPKMDVILPKWKSRFESKRI